MIESGIKPLKSRAGKVAGEGNSKPGLSASISAAIVVAASVFLSACAVDPVAPSNPDRLVQNEGRVGFIENRNSDQRDQVLSRGSSRFGVQPACSYQKTGLTNSRRAVLIEDCLFDLKSKQLAYAGAPIDRVSYRFIDGRLLQMQLEFARSAEGTRINRISQTIVSDLQLSRAKADTESAAGAVAHRWEVDKDIVELSSTSDTAAAALRIADARLADKVIAQR